MCDDLEYSTDTRRNDRNQAKVNHFKSGKKQIRCHKDVVAKEKSISEENDASKLNFKTRSLLAKETMKLMKDQRDEPSDTIVDLDSIKVCINKLSLLYLAGTELDYGDGLNGKGCEWINPNATRTCGCGESFSL